MKNTSKYCSYKLLLIESILELLMTKEGSYKVWSLFIEASQEQSSFDRPSSCTQF